MAVRRLRPGRRVGEAQGQPDLLDSEIIRRAPGETDAAVFLDLWIGDEQRLWGDVVDDPNIPVRALAEAVHLQPRIGGDLGLGFKAAARLDKANALHPVA